MEDNNNDDDQANLNVTNSDHLTCNICFKVKKTVSAPKYHVRTAHDEREKICPDCGIMVKGAKAMLSHRQTHQEKECPHCHKVTKNLSQHLSYYCKKKGGDKPMFSCDHDQCKYQSPVKAHLKRHKESVHEKNVSCDICGHKAANEKFLASHKFKNHQPKKAKDPPPLWYCCQEQGCKYQSKKKFNLQRHEKTCPQKLMRLPLNVNVTDEMLQDLFSEIHVTMLDFRKWQTWMMKTFGKQFFSQTSLNCIKQYCHSLQHYHDTKKVEFWDGKEWKEKTMAFIKDTPQFLLDMAKERGITNPEISLGCDSGRGKMIVTATIHDPGDTITA